VASPATDRPDPGQRELGDVIGKSHDVGGCPPVAAMKTVRVKTNE
jgi:hypothetical protein